MSRICPRCRTVQVLTQSDYCENCAARVALAAWLDEESAGDPLLGIEVRYGLRVVQPLYPNELTYRVRDADREFVAKFAPIDRLALDRDWQRGAYHLSSVATRKISRFIDAFECGDYGVVLMEQTTAQRLRERIESAGPLEVLDAIDVCSQICVGLLAIHSLPGRPVHGRLNSGSATVSGHPKAPLHVSLTDFGLATGLRVPHLYPQYYPQGRDDHQLTTRDDVFAIGSVMFEALTARDPSDAWLSPEIADIAPSPLKPPSTFRPELRHWVGVDALVQDLTASTKYGIESVAEALDRLEQLRTKIEHQPDSKVLSPSSSHSLDILASGAASTTSNRQGHSTQDRPKTDARKRSVVVFENIHHSVHVRGSVLKLRNIRAGRRWGPASRIIDLRDHDIQGEVTAVCGNNTSICFGTSLGTFGRYSLEKEEMEVFAEAESSAAIAAVHCGANLLAAGSMLGELLIRYDQTLQRIRSPYPVEYVSVSDAERLVAVGLANGTVTVYELGEELEPIFVKELGTAGKLSLSDSGRMLTLREGDTTRVIDLETGDEVTNFGTFDDLIAHPSEMIHSVAHSRKSS